MIEYEQVDPITGKIILSGFVGENTDFDLSQVSNSIRTLHVLTRDILTLSSIGIARWIEFFNPLRDQGIKLEFHQCSDLVIRQGTYMMNGFIFPDEIIDCVLPYFCVNCDRDFKIECLLKELKKTGFHPPEANCPKCGKIGEFDDEPELFFQIFISK